MNYHEFPVKPQCFMVKSPFTPSHLRSQGLEETSATQNDVCRVELLMAKVRVEAQGRAGAQRWVKNVLFVF